MYKYVIFGLAALGLAGCATRGDVEEVRVVAMEAQRVANLAAQKADVAVQTSKDTSAKLDAMFKKSMYK